MKSAPATQASTVSQKVSRDGLAPGTSPLRLIARQAASIVLQMLASGAIGKRGAVLQERDVPADLFLAEMSNRGIQISYSEG